jgi:hypothetical protein
MLHFLEGAQGGGRIKLSASETGITSIIIIRDKYRSDAERGDSVDKLI